MSAVLLEPQAWAAQQFGSCALGDQRRTQRLVKLATQAAARPDGSTPDQTETWADCKAAYRLFDQADVTFAAIIEPHCRQTRAEGEPGSVKLILNDTTQIQIPVRRTVRGLGPTGNGRGQGFFLHSGLMVDAPSGRIEGLAGQRTFYRPAKRPRGLRAKDTHRRSGQSESRIWGELIEAIGSPPADVHWIHVCDRGADDFEVFCRALRQNCGFVIRAGRLNRGIHTPEGQSVPLRDYLDRLPAQGVREIQVGATKKAPARTARVELRFGPLRMPRPRALTPWLRQHAPAEPLPLWVVELREVAPPRGVAAVRWVLYTPAEVASAAQAETVIGHYEQRPTIEDYHKALKTGCRVEHRQYQTAERLERVTGLLSVLAVRLLQLKTAARQTPDRPAREIAPARWIAMLQRVRRQPPDCEITIHQFVRALAGLGGHLGRKRDGEPGWITLWRGFEKLHLLLRGAEAARQKCG